MGWAADCWSPFLSIDAKECFETLLHATGPAAAACGTRTCDLGGGLPLGALARPRVTTCQKPKTMGCAADCWSPFLSIDANECFETLLHATAGAAAACGTQTCDFGGDLPLGALA